MASSLFVVLPIAETTTTGRRAARARTIAATRSMAVADSTEVPPNFITIIEWRLAAVVSHLGGCPVYPSIQHALRVHQLGIEHGRSRGAADGVVRERNEFIVEHRTRAQPPDERRHATVALGVLARLRPVILRHVGHRLGPRARPSALLRG